MGIKFSILLKPFNCIGVLQALLNRITKFTPYTPLRLITLISLLTVLSVFLTNKTKAASNTDTDMVYIIEFEEKPVAQYKGSIAGYPATSPSESGKKLDFKQPDIVRYRAYLDQKKSVYLDKIEALLKRKPLVIQSFDVSFFGIVIRMKEEEASKIRNIEGIKQVRADELRTLMNGPLPYK